MFSYTTNLILVITRAKLNGLGEHWGVQLQDGTVAHYTDDRNLLISSIEEFAQGRDVRIVREVPPHEAAQVPQRLWHIITYPRAYDAINWNCEIFANWLTGATPTSGQVTAWLVGGAVIGLMAVIAAA